MYLEFVLNTHAYLFATLILTAIFGDYMVKNTKIQLHRAIFDNTTHAFIGALSWSIVSIIHKNRNTIQTLVEIGLCMSIASCIDLDHFIVARSLYLKDATSLKNRPPLHCTTVPVIIVFVLITIAYCQGTKWILRLSFIILTAFFSHHTRDAVRRGFWFYPFGTTKAIPYFGYITLTIITPYIVSLFMNYVQIKKLDNVPITV